MNMVASYRSIWLFYICCFYQLIALCTACDHDYDCNIGITYNEKCCHGTCISKDSACISGAAIAGIVIGCLIIGGIIISCCLCFCCACGPFQNRSQGTVIRYGGHATQTTTTGVSSYPTASVQAGYGAPYSQPASAVQYPGDASYPQQGTAAYQGNTAPYPQPNAAFPSTGPPPYDEASKPPPYNPGYPQ